MTLFSLEVVIKVRESLQDPIRELLWDQVVKTNRNVTSTAKIETAIESEIK